MCRPQPVTMYNKGMKQNNSMFNSDLTPMFDNRVLMNESAIKDPVVQAAMHDMAKRDFKPQEINRYGVWYISDRH